MDNRIAHRAPWIPWAATAVLLTIVAIVAYVFGTHQAAGMVAADSAGRTWPHHPFPGIFGLIFFFWILGGLRWMFWGAWGGPWRHRRGPWGYRYSDRCADDDLSDWHRREHDRMSGTRAGAASPDADQRPV